MYHNADFLSNQELKDWDLQNWKKYFTIKKYNNCWFKNIFLEDNVRIDPFTFLLCPKGFIKIEKFTHVASHVFIAGHNGFKLGKFSGLGAGTKIYTSSEDYSGEGLCNLNLSQKNKLISQSFKKLIKKKVFIGIIPILELILLFFQELILKITLSVAANF